MSRRFSLQTNAARCGGVSRVCSDARASFVSFGNHAQGSDQRDESFVHSLWPSAHAREDLSYLQPFFG
jgi:hypothetical protein